MKIVIDLLIVWTIVVNPVCFSQQWQSSSNATAASSANHLRGSTDQRSLVLWNAPGDTLSTKRVLNIVQIGDSWSAGNGARYDEASETFIYNLPNQPAGCHRNSWNWGGQLNRLLLQHFHTYYINRACHGAVTSNEASGVVYEKSRWLTKDDPEWAGLDGECDVLPFPDQQSLEYDEDAPMFDECPHFLARQADFVDKSTDIVLLTIGGNDLFFAEVVEECFFLGFGNNCWNAIEKAETLLNNGIFKTRIISALQAIRKRIRDDAIIILPTYPDIVRKGSTRWLMAKLKFDAAERVRMTRNALQREQQAAVDQVNRDNGLKGGFVYFFTESKKVFENREPLPNLDDPWDPNSYIWDIRVPGVTSGPDTWLDEWYHPNEQGHQAWGKAIYEEFKDRIISRFPVVSSGPDGSIDLAIVIDRTGSMSPYIEKVKEDLEVIFTELQTVAKSFQVGLVSYDDFFPEGLDFFGAKVELQLTDKIDDVRTALDNLIVSGGGDTPEAVHTGVWLALTGLTGWQAGTKIMLVIGDAPPKWPPLNVFQTEITADEIVKLSLALDPVQIFSLDMGGGLDSTGKMTELADATQGAVITTDVGGLVEKFIDVIKLAGSQPFAWIGEGYVGKKGSPVVFDASGSRSQDNTTLEKYEWDFEGDGVYDETTTVPNATKTYNWNFSGYVKVRVTTSSNLSSIASASVLINEKGTVPQLRPGESPSSKGPVFIFQRFNVTEGVSNLRAAVNSVSPSLLDLPMANVQLHEGGFHGGLDNLRTLAESQLPPPASVRRELNPKAAKGTKATKAPRSTKATAPPATPPVQPPLNSEKLKEIINMVETLEVALGYK